MWSLVDQMLTWPGAHGVDQMMDDSWLTWS
jgi:hypothetical protein